MDVLLIRGGVVENVISADSVERAQQFYPLHLCIERAGAVGPGWLTPDDGATFTPPPAPPAPIPDRRITRLAFRNRFTTTEKVTIELAGLDNPAASSALRQQAAALRVYLSDVAASNWIDLSRAETRGGVQALEALGLLAAGRAAVILDSAIREIEQPPALSQGESA